MDGGLIGCALHGIACQKEMKALANTVPVRAQEDELISKPLLRPDRCRQVWHMVAYTVPGMCQEDDAQNTGRTLKHCGR
eukprot:987676-Pelagomonas_calceolata.AAC.3